MIEDRWKEFEESVLYKNSLPDRMIFYSGVLAGLLCIQEVKSKDDVEKLIDEIQDYFKGKTNGAAKETEKKEA